MLKKLFSWFHTVILTSVNNEFYLVILFFHIMTSYHGILNKITLSLYYLRFSV